MQAPPDGPLPYELLLEFSSQSCRLCRFCRSRRQLLLEVTDLLHLLLQPVPLLQCLHTHMCAHPCYGTWNQVCDDCWTMFSNF